MAALLLCETASPVCSVDPAALCVSVRLHVILPLFRPEISTDPHCSTHRSAATGCSAQYLCTLSCFSKTIQCHLSAMIRGRHGFCYFYCLSVVWKLKRPRILQTGPLLVSAYLDLTCQCGKTKKQQPATE